MAKLGLERNVVDIEIEDMKFEVNLSDKELANFKKQYDKSERELRRIEAEQAKGAEPEDTIAEMNKHLSHLYDILLGEGAYEKLYARSGSVYVLTNLLFDIVNISTKEIEKKNKDRQKKAKEENNQLSARYLNKKRKSHLAMNTEDKK